MNFFTSSDVAFALLLYAAAQIIIKYVPDY
uniref:Uncharacterized protein n=1 Tax=Anguilla anguilla TaxID=7936 RepID=A0A0E9U2B0_ANGAN